MPQPVICISCTRARTGGGIGKISPHACDDPFGCDCVYGHATPGPTRLPRAHDRGCASGPDDMTRCVIHDSELVLIPVFNSSGGINTRMCRAALTAAAATPAPAPPRPTVVDQLASRMDTGVYAVNLASHAEAARRTLAALPALDDETVNELAATVRAQVRRWPDFTDGAVPAQDQSAPTGDGTDAAAANEARQPQPTDEAHEVPHPGRFIKGFWVCDAHDLAECPWCPARQQDGDADQ